MSCMRRGHRISPRFRRRRPQIDLGDSLPKGTDEEGKVEEEEIQSSATDDLIQLTVNPSELKHDNISSVSLAEASTSFI